MDITIENHLGRIVICEILKPGVNQDHLGRVLLKIEMSDKCIYQRVEEVTKTIKALQLRKNEMLEEIKLEESKVN